MTRIILNRLILPFSIIFLLSFSGCFLIEEEIAVSEDGTTSIIATFTGAPDDFHTSFATPSEPGWELLEQKIDSSKSDKEKVVKSRLVVPYGQPLPSAYAERKNADYDQSLHFPTEVKNWRDGKYTYYEFKRTYQARTYKRYHSDDIEQKLEKKIIDKGIFEVTANERAKYLQQIKNELVHQNLYMFIDALGTLVENEELSVDNKIALESRAKTVLKDLITGQKILDILSKDDDSIGVAYDLFAKEIEKALCDELTTVTGGDKDNEQVLKPVLDLIITDNKITALLDDRTFSVVVRLPGEIIKTNGESDREEPGGAGWSFEGKDLHDRDIPLYALSVVENR